MERLRAIRVLLLREERDSHALLVSHAFFLSPFLFLTLLLSSDLATVFLRS